MFTKTANVEKSLLQDILSGNYAPGSRIPSQNQLMRKYGVSRTTLLRAMNKLTADGYLLGKQGSGTFVNSLKSKSRTPANITVIGMHGEEYPFDQVLSDIGQVYWCTEKEAGTYLDKLSRPGNAVIWLLPHPSSMLMMDFLHRRGIPQLLINRNYRNYDCILSDVKKALKDGMTKLWQGNTNAPALIAHRPSELRPYLSDYIIYFYEVCSELGMRMDAQLNFCCDYSPERSEFRQIGKRLFGGKEPVREIVVLNFELVLPTLMSAAGYGWKCGKDFSLLTIETSPEWKDVPGISSVCHDYRGYAREISQWLNGLSSAATPQVMKIKLPCKMV